MTIPKRSHFQTRTCLIQSTQKALTFYSFWRKSGITCRCLSHSYHMESKFKSSTERYHAERGERCLTHQLSQLLQSYHLLCYFPAWGNHLPWKGWHSSTGETEQLQAHFLSNLPHSLVRKRQSVGRMNPYQEMNIVVSFVQCFHCTKDKIHEYVRARKYKLCIRDCT